MNKMEVHWSDTKTTIIDITVFNRRVWIYKYPITSNGTLIKYKYNKVCTKLN